MKIQIDRTACLKSGQCSYLHAELFERDADDFPVPRVEDADEALKEAIEDAIELCPGMAISLVEDGG